MDVTFRLLNDDEYEKLKGLGPNDDWIPSPANSKVVVGEEDGKIVAFWVMQAVIHLEPVWIAEEHRKSMIVAGSLMNSMRILLSYLGINRYFAFSDGDETSRYLEKLQFKKLPFEVWRGGEELCRS